MPAAVGAILGIAGVVGGAVLGLGGMITGVVGGLASVIGGVLAGIGGAIVPVVTSLAATLGTAVVKVGAAISSLIISSGAYAGSTMVRAAGSITAAIGNLSAGLYSAIESIAIPVTKAITDAAGAITYVVDPIATAILTPIKDTLVLVAGAVDMIKAPVNALLEPVIAARELINSVASLKILYDVLRGAGEISDMLGAIGDGEAAKTAEAIAILYRDITSTTVGMINKVDVETKALWASVDKFDERIKTSVDEGVEITKAEIMAMLTPRLDTMGAGSDKLTGELARLTRHLEDVPWFMWMLIRALR